MSKVQHLCFIIHEFKTFLPSAKAVRQMEYASAFQAVWISAMMLWQTCGLVLWDQYAGEVRGKIPAAMKWKDKFSKVCLEGSQKLILKSQEELDNTAYVF